MNETRALIANNWDWHCLSCSGPLQRNVETFTCRECGRQYPIVQGIAVLVHDPVGYLRSELSALDRVRSGAMQRRRWIDEEGQNSGLTEASLTRHANVLDTEISRVETFISMLEPTRDRLASIQSTQQSGTAGGTGWGFDALFPYMLRDWTGTQELRSAAAIIGEAVESAFPDSFEKTIVFAGCGAGGLLDEISLAFGRVVGFDLTFPVLVAARHLLDGHELKLPMPRAVNPGGTMVLRRRRADKPSPVQLVAMDAFNTAFAGDSVDCIVTSFLLDLLPDPTKLAKEINRVLCDGGIWINYGPSGPLQSLWRFDEGEGRAFFEAAQFDVLNYKAARSTYLDLSRDCPSWSFQNHVCYLTVARKKADIVAELSVSMPATENVLDVIPEHNSGAVIIRRQRLDGGKASRLFFQYERFPGRSETLEISAQTAGILEIVDGRRTIREIARLLQEQDHNRAPTDTVSVLASYLERNVLKGRPS